MQLDIMDPTKEVGFSIIDEKEHRKDYLLKLENNELIVEKESITFYNIEYYLEELKENDFDDIDYETELNIGLNQDLEAYFNLDEVKYSIDGFILVKDLCINISPLFIEIEGGKKGDYFIDESGLSEKKLIDLKNKLIIYIKDTDFSVF